MRRRAQHDIAPAEACSREASSLYTIRRPPGSNSHGPRTLKHYPASRPPAVEYTPAT